MSALRWLVLLMMAVGAGRLEAGERLQWKLEKGDTLKYRVSNAMEMTSSTGGPPEKMTLTQTMDMDWDVATELDNGAVVDQTIRRIVVKLSPNGVDEFLFDSDSQNVPENRIVRSLANAFQKIVDQTFVVTMESTGQVSDVTIPPGLQSALRSAAAGSPGALDENALRKLMSQATVVLPKAELETGDSWKSDQEVDLGFATLEMTPQMTYQGLNVDGYAVIEYIPELKLTAAKGAAVQLTLTKSNADGEVLFDPKNGRVVSMELTLDMEMKAVNKGVATNQTIRQRTEMKLAEPTDQ